METTVRCVCVCVFFLRGLLLKTYAYNPSSTTLTRYGVLVHHHSRSPGIGARYDDWFECH